MTEHEILALERACLDAGDTVNLPTEHARRSAKALREGLADRRRLDGYERRVDDVRAAAMRAEDELVDRESL